jgi:hypothetical protein
MTRPDDHIDLDAAAALDEGLEVDDAVRAHAAACDECGRRVAAVRTTRALLSALPDETMPPAVIDRLHDALPREPVLTTIVPSGGRRRRWTSSPALAGIIAAAAALALVAAISIGSLRSSGHDSSGSAGAGTGAAGLFPRVASTNFPVLASGAKYNNRNAQALVSSLDSLVRTPTTLAGGGAADQSRPAQKDTVSSLSSQGPVPAQLRDLFGNRQQLLACARLLAGGPVTPLAIDFSLFTGGQRHVHNAPAMIVLLPAVGGLRDSAFIVGPRCTTDPSQDFYLFVQAPAR